MTSRVRSATTGALHIVTVNWPMYSSPGSWLDAFKVSLRGELIVYQMWYTQILWVLEGGIQNGARK